MSAHMHEVVGRSLPAGSGQNWSSLRRCLGEVRESHSVLKMVVSSEGKQSSRELLKQRDTSIPEHALWEDSTIPTPVSGDHAELL